MCSWFLIKYICIITHTFFGTYLNVGKLGKNQLKDNVYKNWENMNHKYCIVIHDSFLFTQFQGTGMSFFLKKKKRKMKCVSFLRCLMLKMLQTVWNFLPNKHCIRATRQVQQPVGGKNLIMYFKFASIMALEVNIQLMFFYVISGELIVQPRTIQTFFWQVNMKPLFF